MVRSHFFAVGNDILAVENDFFMVGSHFLVVGSHFLVVERDLFMVVCDFWATGRVFFSRHQHPLRVGWVPACAHRRQGNHQTVEKRSKRTLLSS